MAGTRSEAKLGLNISDFERSLSRATDGLNKFAKGGIGSMDGLVGSVGRLAGTFGLAASAASVLQDSIAKATNFEKAVSSLQSLTGMSNTEMAYFKDAAIQMGAKSTQTASQVVEAFKLIGSAKPELLKSKEALKDVTSSAITLAEAAGIDVPEAAKALTGIMNQFGMSASSSNDIINTLAAASQQGAGDINYLNSAITKSGSVAKSMGVSVEESVACIEQLAQSGVDSSTAGTALRNVMLALAKTGKSELSPANVGLVGSLRNLRKMGLSTVEMMNMFGKENIAAAQTLMNTADNADKMKTAITGTNTAFEQAKINNDNFAGSINSLSSAWEGLMLTINSSNGLLKWWVDRTTNLIKNITYLVSTDDQKISMMVDAQMNGSDGNNGLKAALKREMDALYKSAADEGKAVGAGLKWLDEWYERATKNSNLTELELKALSEAYKKAKKYVTDYYKEVETSSDTNKIPDLPTTPDADNDKKLDGKIAQASIKYEMDSYDPWEVVNQSIASRGPVKVPVEFDTTAIDSEDAMSASFDNDKAIRLAVDLESLKKYREELVSLRKEALTTSTELASSITSLGDTLANLGKTFENCKTAWDYFSASMNTAISIIDGIVSITEAYNTLQKISAALKTKDASAAAVESAANLTLAGSLQTSATAAGVDTAAQLADASAKTFNAHSWIPYVGVALAAGMVGVMLGMMMSLPKFAEGAYADRPTIGVFGEAGPELVLPEKKLDEAFERNGYNNGYMGGEVEFKIRDSYLVGILKQYNSKSSYKV